MSNFSRDRQYDFLFFISLIFFVILKSTTDLYTPIFDLEEFIKIQYQLETKGILYFLPGSHPPGAFYGHPGLLQFILNFLAFFLGNSLAAIRTYLFTFSIFLLISLYITTSIFYKKSTAPIKKVL